MADDEEPERRFEFAIDEADARWSGRWRTSQRFFRLRGHPQLRRLALNDLIDVRAAQTDGQLLCVAYPLVGSRRERRDFRLRSDEPAEFERRLRRALEPPVPPHRPPPSIVASRRVLVLVNPHSGTKRALARWEKSVRPLFDQMRVVYELKRTEHANHAVELMQRVDLDDYAAVAVLSGDGLIAEVLRGLLTRADDRDRALRFPILHVPCGTSNALAGAVCFKSREPFSPRDDFSRELALMVACPVYRGLRLQHVQTAHDGDWLMFMTAAWGLIADIDLGSERFRALGLIRLHVEAFIRIAQLPTMARYKGRVSYKPVNDKQLHRHTLLKAEEAWRELGAAHFASGRVELFNGNAEGDGEVESGGSSENSIRSVAEAFEGTHVGGETPALSSPVPSDWVTMEGEFVFVCCSALSHLGSDLPYIPSARMEEEVFYLTFIDWRTLKSRFHMGHLLITVDRCTHLDHTCLHMLPVTACRIEPAAGAGGFIAIDGEPVTSGAPFQVTSTSLQATVIARDNQR